MMSRFQATISTFAAIGTIGLTVVAVYRAVDEQKQRDLRNQEEIQTLRDQLRQQLEQTKSDDGSEATPSPAPESWRPSLGAPEQRIVPAPSTATDAAGPVPPPPLPPVPEASE